MLYNVCPTLVWQVLKYCDAKQHSIRIVYLWWFVFQGQHLGWSEACPTVTEDIEEPTAKQWLTYYNDKASAMQYKTIISQWNYAANITDYNQAVMVS